MAPGRKAHRLAKLTRPRLHGAIARERLFAKLDQMREQRNAICVIGPPGAGKTTLVASWLDGRKLPGIWYQVDAGDTDLASFFHYLGQAAASFSAAGDPPLPALTPEYLEDVAGFTRRFFRALFARLPAPATLVLDNYQEVVPEHPFHAVVAQAVDEVPEHICLLVVSRRDPPDAYARLVANENVGRIDWEDLKLTLEEAGAIARRTPGLDDAQILALHEACGGWAAGVVLTVEPYRKGIETTEAAAESREALFSYFASIVFGRVSDEVSRFLVATSLLPEIAPPVAQRLTGNPRSEQILDDMYRRRLFTHRRAGAPPTYQYHAMFRQFLRARAAATLETEALRRLKAEAGAALETQGQREAAVGLYVEAEHWAEATRLIVEQAPGLLAEGRWKTLLEWVGAVPRGETQASPALLLWSGCARMQTGLAAAREELERAFQGFRAARDTTGQVRAAAMLINSYYFEYGDFAPLDAWILALEQLLSRTPALPDRATELLGYSALLIGIAFRQPEHRMVEACAQRVAELLNEDLDANQLASAAAEFISYCGLAADFERARPVIERINRLMETPAATALNRAFWWLYLAFHYHMLADRTMSAACLDRADSVADEHGLRQTSAISRCFRVYLDTGWLDVESAERLVGEIPARLDPARTMDAAQYHLACTCLGIAKEDGPYAARHAQAAWARLRRLGSPALNVPWLSIGALAFTLDRQYENANAWLAQAWEESGRGFLVCFRPYLWAIRAWAALARGDAEACATALREALALAREGKGACFLRWMFGLLGILFAEALRGGIEPEFVKELIRRWRVQPPPNADYRWPWPVQVFTLGGFKLLRSGVPASFAHKAPKKPIAVLKALVAMGGRNVPEHELIDALWSGEDGDAAREAFRVSLHRLRKLLGDANAVSAQEGRLSLDPARCWVDVWDFERQSGDRDGQSQARDNPRHADPVLQLYRGPFLPEDAGEPWTLSMRERVRGKLVRHVARIGRQLEERGLCAAAVEYYNHGIEADDLAEQFYQGLMRSYARMDRPAEAMAAYRRLRQALSVQLGIPPSQASEKLFRSLQRP